MTDEQVISAVLEGDGECFRILVERYQNVVYSVCIRYSQDSQDAADLAQEIFLLVYQRLHMFRGQSKFSTWLYRLSVNRCIDYTRVKKRERARDGGEVETRMADTKTSVEGDVLKRERNELLAQVLDELPERYKSVLVLHYTNELNYKQIADVLELPVKTVETRLYRARKKLRERFEELGG